MLNTLQLKQKDQYEVDTIPNCFGLSQLPVEIEDNSTTGSSFNIIEYESTLDYFAVGGFYGSRPLIGLYNNKENFNRFVWLNTYDYDQTTINLTPLQQVETLVFSKQMHIIALIRTIKIGDYEYTDKGSLLVMRVDLQGLAEKTCYFDNYAIFRRPMINAISINQSNGDIYLLIVPVNQQGYLLVIKNDLSQITQFHSVNEYYAYYCSVYFYPQLNKAFAMGVWMPVQTNLFGIFVSIFDENLPSNYVQRAIKADNLQQYQVIIPLMEQNLGLLAGCFEGTNNINDMQTQSTLSEGILALESQLDDQIFLTFADLSDDLFAYQPNMLVPRQDDLIYLGFSRDLSGRLRAYLNYFFHNSYLQLLTDIDPTLPHDYANMIITGFDLSTATFDIINTPPIKTPPIQAYQNLLPYVSLWHDYNSANKWEKMVSQLSVNQLLINWQLC
ncbi:UNKNOWN [Stylonychia lemnae]|uniref:Uncharacterized protein n=1 Tax=Stylonychia lemnae TaxID=5949 RepID=A0A077ZT69_STYLE|nr:UNKNOWN [Stylonychia lemnae]|eukprot:CDW72510.1 UNKNOWN [Stylonychia lemnae]